MDSKKLLKALFKRAVLNFASVNTDKGDLIIEGDIEVGKPVFIETEGETVSPVDGEYLTNEVKIKIENGIITEVEKIEAEDVKPAETEEVKTDEVDAKKCEMSVNTDEVPEYTEEKPAENTDEKDAKIAELEQMLNDKDTEIENLKAKIAELEDKSNKPVEEPVTMNKVPKAFTNNENPALRFFQD